MNKENIKTKRLYMKPFLQRVVLDKELSLTMWSQPPSEPGDPASIGGGPGYVQKGIKFLIR